MDTIFNLYEVDRVVEERRRAQYAIRQQEDPYEQAAAVQEEAADLQRIGNQPEQAQQIAVRVEAPEATRQQELFPIDGQAQQITVREESPQATRQQELFPIDGQAQQIAVRVEAPQATGQQEL